MAARAGAVKQNLVLKSFTVEAGQSVTKGRLVKFGSSDSTVQHAGAGEDGIGIVETQGTSAEGKIVTVALLAGAGTIPVVVGTGGATRGAFAFAAANGLTDRSVGGGTVARYVVGKFLQSGVAGDEVEMLPLTLPTVSA